MNLIDFGMNVQAGRRGAAHRARRLARRRPGSPATPTAARSRPSRASPKPWSRNWSGAATRSNGCERNGGGYQGILIDPKTGMLHGGSEAAQGRRGGGVLRQHFGPRINS